MTNRIPVLRDKNVDQKRYKRSPVASMTDVYELRLGQRAKRGNFVNPLWTLNECELGYSVLSSEADAARLAEILRIMGGGRKSMEDALTLDAASRNGCLYVVTNDKDEFIRDGKREQLQALLPNVKIVRLDELESALATMVPNRM